MNKNNMSMRCFIDCFGYDHSAAECIMRRSGNSAEPLHLWVGTCWADANTRDDHGEGKRAEPEDCQVASGGHQAAWQSRSMPILQKSDFQITFPSGADTLPFTQKFLDAMAEKLSSAPEELRAEWEQVMKDHNALYNPESKAYDGSKRQAEGGTPEPMMRGVTP